MNLLHLIRRNLSHHWRSNLAIMLGGAVGCMIIIGALLVGESVQASLRQLALARLGKIDQVLEISLWTLHESIGEEIAQKVGGDGTSVLKLSGFATTPDERHRANDVNLLGINDTFWNLAHEPMTTPAPGEILLNEELAQQLDVDIDDTIIVTVNKPGDIPAGLPFVDMDRYRSTVRARVAGIVPEQSLGKISLRANQVLPYNGFVDLDWLQQQLENVDGINLVLLSRDFDYNVMRDALRESLRFSDLDIRIRELPDNKGFHLDTTRVFMPVDTVFRSNAIRREKYPDRERIFSYFVNSISSENSSTPYSIVSAIDFDGDSQLAPKIKSLAGSSIEGRIVLTDWLAEDLEVAEGDEIFLSYYKFTSNREIEEVTSTFSVFGIVPIEEVQDPFLMPPFPGISDAEDCSEWDPEFQIDLSRIRDKDEQYWDKYGGSPKAFISPSDAQRLWENPYGSVTGFRILRTSDTPEEIKKTVLSSMQLDFRFRPVRSQALQASMGTTDFSGLFAGLSFFLIVAALLLMALLYRLDIQSRGKEFGMLRALGFTGRRLFLIRFAESFTIAIMATILGALLAGAYTRGIIMGLRSVWSGAGVPSNLMFHGTLGTRLLGMAVSLGVILITMLVSLRGQMRSSVIGLLKRVHELPSLKPGKGVRRRQPGVTAFRMAIVSMVLSIGIIVYATYTGSRAVEAFFGAGAALLTAFLAIMRFILVRGIRPYADSTKSLLALSSRNLSRRSFRVVAATAILACGVFLLISVGVHVQTAEIAVSDPASGTGGYELYATTALPIQYDLNTEEGLNHYGLSKAALPNVSFLQFRVHEGDEASCLNLNRPQQPRVLGVDIEALTSRPGFRVIKEDNTLRGSAGILSGRQQIPAFLSKDITGVCWIDETTAKWSLKKSLHDLLIFQTEANKRITLLISGLLSPSILQGNVLVVDKQFATIFPEDAGYRMFLIDCPLEQRDVVNEKLTRSFRDYGMSLTDTEKRLAQFRAVENTYLAIFQLLGGLGLILGTIGLGIVLLRNSLERRSEMAVMTALGFTRSRLRKYMLLEHALILILGTVFGSIAGLTAMVPALFDTGRDTGLTIPLFMLSGILLIGLISIYFSTKITLRGALIKNLRNE